MNLTPVELAELIRARAGITVAPDSLAAPGATFEEFGVDSLALLGIVGELENEHGTPMPVDAERCKTPQQFLNLVNNTLMAGA